VRRALAKTSLPTSNRRLRYQRASVLADLVGARKKVEELISSRSAEAEPLRLDGNRRRKTETSLLKSNRRLRYQRASVLADRV